MKAIWSIIPAVFLGMMSGGTAHAGLYQDDLSRCIVEAAKEKDRKLLVHWVFAAMAANPTIKPMANISAEQAENWSRDSAALMQRLLLKDCRKQTVSAVKYEGVGTIQQAFTLLGQIAMADLMQEEHTGGYIRGLDRHLDKEQWSAFGKEVGVAMPAPGK